MPYEQSNLQNLQSPQALFKDVHYLLIDEKSMVGLYQLSWVDQACCYIFPERDTRFGGLSVILCGDFYQLPPVFQTEPFYNGRLDHRDETRGREIYLAFAQEAINELIQFHEYHALDSPTQGLLLQLVAQFSASERHLEIRGWQQRLQSADSYIATVFDTTANRDLAIEGLKTVAFRANGGQITLTVCPFGDTRAGKVVTWTITGGYADTVDSAAKALQRKMPVTLPNSVSKRQSREI
ncbi:hypothetical protein FQN53_003635 [Emmonsiellopsis sp. PD_33]|nr:hypothetical protein FQN53_003635 [Emmonsiellopsis sp. PD_33]